MYIPKGACPIVLPCIRTFLDRERNSEFSVTLGYVFNDEEWQELESTARDSNPAPESQWLRAFYALELTYHSILPRMFFTASDSQMQKMFLELRADRSVEGLNALIAVGEKYKKRAAAKRTTIAIKDVRQDNSAQIVDILERHLTIVGWLLSSAQNLKSCLRQRKTSGLTSIGVGLGEAFSFAGESDNAVQSHMQTVLRINPQNAVSPWKQPTLGPMNYPA